MMETLFAQQAQSRAFLALLLGGMGVAAAAHGASLFPRGRLWGWLSDVLVALLLLWALLYAVVALEAPLRLYGLLGLALGAALYGAGAGPVAAALFRRVKKSVRKRPGKEENPP